MQVQTVDYLDNDCAQLFVESLRTTGFGVLKNHPISQDLVKSIYNNWYEFFSHEEKHQYHYNIETQDGYFPPDVSEVAKGHQVKDIKEYYHVYPWGQVPAELKAEAMTYYKMANELAAELLGWVEAHTPAKIA